jgi:hypothetical protein
MKNASRALIQCAFHEASHCVLFVLLENRTIDYCEISETSGLTRCVPRSPVPPVPRPDQQRATDLLALSLSGAIAHARIYGDAITNDDHDLIAHGAEGDLEAVNWMSGIICRGSIEQAARLRINASARAQQLVSGLWDEIDAVARILLTARVIGDRDVRSAIGSTPEGALLLPKSRDAQRQTKDLLRPRAPEITRRCDGFFR